MPRRSTHQPRHNPNGRHEHICEWCQVTFRTDNQRTMYCSQYCQQASANDRYYKTHRKQHILSVMLRRARKRAQPKPVPQPRKSTNDTMPDFDRMSSDEISQWMISNPGKWRV